MRDDFWKNRSPAFYWTLAWVSHEIFWLCMLFPYYPKTVAGWLVGIAVTTLFAIWFVICFYTANSLLKKNHPVFWRNALLLVFALVLAGAIFYMGRFGGDFMTQNFARM